VVFGFFMFPSGTERGDLDDDFGEDHVGQPETAPDQPAVMEKTANPIGMRVCDGIKILGAAVEEQIAHTATSQVRNVTAGLQPV
jgi:hypothetical protein